MSNDSIAEKDAIVLLGLLANASVRFDKQFTHIDGVLTHTKGLNIFACIVDNNDGEVLGFGRNEIHTFYNPLLHAEQNALHKSIARINKKNRIDKNRMSVERYYRNEMFNSENPDDFGATLYTTLEPCPFCTSALLVSRMSRIVYLLPDEVYGNSFELLKSKYYNEYFINYELLKFPDIGINNLINSAKGQYLKLLKKVERIKEDNPKISETMLLDYLENELLENKQVFQNINADALISKGDEKKRNLRTLTDLKELVKNYNG
ncbi:MAG: nucleoside deaminase [Ignavibacteriaceae bacterium]|nr:nucleoside deaminase [Ignavibacteriaceae bacterium]